MRNLAKQANSTFEITMHNHFPNLAKVKFVPITNTHIDLTYAPHEDIENFWEMYRSCFPNWD